MDPTLLLADAAVCASALLAQSRAPSTQEVVRVLNHIGLSAAAQLTPELPAREAATFRELAGIDTFPPLLGALVALLTASHLGAAAFLLTSPLLPGLIYAHWKYAALRLAAGFAAGFAVRRGVAGAAAVDVVFRRNTMFAALALFSAQGDWLHVGVYGCAALLLLFAPDPFPGVPIAVLRETLGSLRDSPSVAAYFSPRVRIRATEEIVERRADLENVQPAPEARVRLIPRNFDFACPVCLDRRSEAVTLRCGHHFCSRCVTEIAERSGDFPCPTCRAPQPLADLLGEGGYRRGEGEPFAVPAVHEDEDEDEEERGAEREAGADGDGMRRRIH